MEGFRGATAARLTPDQEVACSNHVEINASFTQKKIISLTCKIILFFNCL
jgi:hypothetical protein